MNKENKKMLDTFSNSWFFVFNYNGSIFPKVIKFVTNKNDEEIKNKFGSIHNSYFDNNGHGLISIWYCDEYSSDYKDLSYFIQKEDANWKVFDIADEEIKNNVDTTCVPVVYLDEVLTKKPLRDTGYYADMKW